MRQRLFAKSDKDTNFTGTLATDVGESESIFCGANDGTIDAVTIQSDQNLAWDIYFWQNSNYMNNTDFDLAFPCGRVSFVATDGLQISGTGAFIYSKQGLSIPYRDLDASLKIHQTLVNRTTPTSKIAGATGETVVQTSLVTNDF